MRARVVVGLLSFACCLFPSVASAQATRTWVSGVGDDVNPCSRTAPCHSIAGALAKTVAGGEIDALDVGDWDTASAGDWNTTVITGAITIDGHFSPSGVHYAGPIIINAGPTDVVVLRNLSLDGNGIQAAGVQFNSGAALHLENCVITQFAQGGVAFNPNQAASLYMINSTIDNVQTGAVLVDGPGFNVTATIWHSYLDSSGIGLTVLGSAQVTVLDTTISNNDVGVEVGGGGGVSDVNLRGVTLTHNVFGLSLISVPAPAFLRLSNVTALDNGTLSTISGNGTIQTFGTNRLPQWTPVCDVRGYSVQADGVECMQLLQSYDIHLDMPGGATPLQYTITAGALPPGVQLVDGSLVGSPTTPGEYSFTIGATDAFGCMADADFALNLVPSCNSSINPNTLPLGLQGHAFDANFTMVNAAPGPVAFAVSGGNLPPGLTLDGNVLSGIPTTSGDYSFVLNSNDSFGCTADQNYFLRVYPQPGPGPTSPDFTVAVSPNPLNLPSSGTGSTTVALTSVNGTFSENIALTCDANPAVSCSFAPASVSVAGGSTTSTLTITVPEVVASRDLGQVMGLACLGMCVTVRRRRQWQLLAGLAMVTCIAGCGDVTKKGNNLSTQVTVRGTSTGGTQHTVVLTVTGTIP